MYHILDGDVLEPCGLVVEFNVAEEVVRLVLAFNALFTDKTLVLGFHLLKDMLITCGISVVKRLCITAGGIRIGVNGCHFNGLLTRVNKTG